MRYFRLFCHASYHGFVQTMVLVSLLWVGLHLLACRMPPDLGEFQGQTNVGAPKLAGSVQFNASDNVYRISAGGANIWGDKDQFFYVWRRVEGDLALHADVNWLGQGKHSHRKAGWMVRAGLESDAPYVDAVVHGDGLVALQYRRTPGGPTHEVKSPLQAPATLLLQRDGDQFTLSILRQQAVSHVVATVTVPLAGSLYAGLAVCSHDTTTLETAVFSNVGFNAAGGFAEEERVLESTLEIIDVETGIRRIVRRAREHFEAPNWSRDGSTLLYNSEGLIYTLPVTGGEPRLLNTGFADRCNNDHGLSPDGKKLVISNNGPDGSLIYILPSTGGEPRQITRLGPSYWHGWSPDGMTLAYCARRQDEYDVYTIPVAGGDEKRLTTAEGLDDGPDYSPDGRYIFFNSIRTGQMKIWRMLTNGADQVQLTPHDDYGDWFPHPSPDGKWLVFLSYHKDVEGHPANKDVVLRIMPAAGGEVKVLAVLFGGQGTINVPSWSPDSKELAFVSYRRVAPQ
jgi:Tol biopolymer transport system component